MIDVCVRVRVWLFLRSKKGIEVTYKIEINEKINFHVTERKTTSVFKSFYSREPFCHFLFIIHATSSLFASLLMDPLYIFIQAINFRTKWYFTPI